MQKIFFTSDNHFYHKNILKFNPNTRNGNTVEELNELMIQQWNSQVSSSDIVYILGDFSFSKSFKTRENILSKLNGILHLVKGNHDYWIDEDSSVFFESISDYKNIHIDNKELILFHFPIFEWKNMDKGSYHLYGHVHGSFQLEGRAMDVGIDARPNGDMGLWEWDEINSILSKKEIRGRSHREC